MITSMSCSTKLILSKYDKFTHLKPNITNTTTMISNAQANNLDVYSLLSLVVKVLKQKHQYFLIV